MSIKARYLDQDNICAVIRAIKRERETKRSRQTDRRGAGTPVASWTVLPGLNADHWTPY